ncbi:MAG TPA: flagellar biosynthesis protein FlhA [Polyangiaceae bacterium]|nr:flagellar biosynthesis protein FlhA [Polyangiaceae bacterium]
MRGRRTFAGADIALAALVVLVVGLMIVPLPTWALDLLISANLSAAVAILLVVLYVPDAIGIATFPTLLLLTTLYRLALNVASTRLILLQANAGEVIRAFGTFVVRGNYVVGAVVFLVLTIIQFIVIAKGSERVAEVGARFALDAMPGKQMAIDAELRSGAIDGNEARRRRRLLQRESQFYGAMDGAMKFVKGDVVATLVILVVNILGGLGIGVAMKGMSVVDALKRYGLLTIGDGLVTQIPALVLSTAAGVLVTRVGSEEADTPLGDELARQLLGVPKALQVAAVFVLLLAVVPGLPALPFVVIGVGLLLVGRARARAKSVEEQRAATEPRPPQAARAGAMEPAFVPLVVPWSLEVSRDLEAELDGHARGLAPDAEAGGLRAMAIGLRERFFAEMGVPLPAPRVRARDGVDARVVVLSLQEVPARVLLVPRELAGAALVDWVRDRTLDLLRARAADFLGLAEVQRLLDELEQFAPATVRNVVPKPVSLVLLTDVLRRLVEERVSIRDLRAILEALAVVAATEKDPLGLSEYVRSALRRAITYRLTAGQGRLPCVMLEPIVEDTVRRAITRTPAGAFLTLAPQASRDVERAIDAALAGWPEAEPPVIMTQPDIRRFVRKLIEPRHPEVWVSSFAELLPEVRLETVTRVKPTT